ncbi:DUF1501 domain-containing protein [Verrucomicrobium sp. BvORR106]|uniref:DUF1501 domain-containing protein n=1 Tax=Verrucomicrobium sp. BvORR106 TaxID=1403819 RepID=UPI00068EAD72|nr:DUF1501 domain-containing protein [Verrucomicrobium sp. BvORR106]
MRLLTNLAVSSSPAVDEAGKHTLVCIFLRGGADTMNLVVPYADDVYYRARPTIGIKPPGGGSASAVRLDDRYGLHPMLQPLQEKFAEGRLSIIQGVGTDNTSGSHFECQDQMEHGDSMVGTPAGGGWLGRFLRARANPAIGPLSAVAIGTTLPESLRGAPVVSVIQSLQEIALKTPSGKTEAAAQALARLYGADVTLLGQQGRETLDLFERVRQLQTNDYAPAHGAKYSKDGFGNGLREVARLIKARVGLEVACLDLGGWDTHFIQGAAEGLQAQRAKVLGEGLAAFDDDLKEHRQNVTVMVMTEFGRRIYENSSLGTDHGRGFATLVLSERLRGGQILGGWPCVVEETLTGPGGMKISHDYRSVFGEVLKGAMGLGRPQEVFPEFAPRPVGLLA